MKRCLMLDVDGVLVTGRPEDGGSWASDIERDLGIAPARLHAVFFAPHWSDIVTGRKDLLTVLAACLPELSPSLSAQAFVDYWFEKDSRVDPAVLAACASLREQGLRIFLATNQEHLRAAYLMERLGLRQHVDGMIYSAAVAARKPEPAFFAAAATRSGAAPEDILLVDDTEANVAAARAAGWHGLHWTAGSNLIELMQDWPAR